MQLRPYQTKGIDDIAINFSKGIRKQIFQLATGGGKTITFAGLVDRYHRKFTKKALILVHRDELLTQTKNTFQNGFGARCDVITSKKTTANGYSKVIVGMVETCFNRIKKQDKIFKDVGLLIVDECHIGNFKKIYEYFPDALIVGFSATPISGQKKDPLNNYFEEIVQGPSIHDLIDLGSLCENETFSLKGIPRASLKIKNGEYDIEDMGTKFSNSKNILNTVSAHQKLCNGEKTMIFNCNIEHSKLVNQAFIDAGYNSRHIDGTEPDNTRKEIIQWFKVTPGAILNNIAVLTTGFDEPTVSNIIINRSTMSLALWLQMTGRGSRPINEWFILNKQNEYPYKLQLKSTFRIIDMGGNVSQHGDWREDRDWYNIFHNPAQVYDSEGEAPVKECKGCGEIIPAQAVVCKHCGHVHERIITYDMIAPEFEKLVDAINVGRIIEECEGRKEWAPFYQILGKTVTNLKYRAGGEEITFEIMSKSFEKMENKVKEWRRIKDMPYSKATREFAWKAFSEQISRINKGILKEGK